MSVPPECQGLADAIEELRARIRGYQHVQEHTDALGKRAMAQLIARTQSEIDARMPALLACITENGGTPPPRPLHATFAGTASFTTSNGDAPGPYDAEVVLGLLFNAERTVVLVVDFPPITTEPFSTPMGESTTTVSRLAGGRGAYSAGEIVLPITLLFDHSVDLPFYHEDSTLDLTLATAPPGSPVDGSGAVTLNGSGGFQKGFLGGDTGDLTIAGSIVPVP